MIEAYQGVPLLGFIAASGTGKTTLLGAVIPLLSKAGLRVGCIKHTHHRFDIDRPGKDSYLLRQAGAQQILIGGRDRWALIVEADSGDEPPLESMISSMQLATLDLVLVEGFKLASLPKIEIHRAELELRPQCAEEDTIIALATNQKPPPRVSVPVLDLDDPQDVARFILARVERTRTLQSGAV
jgi:molybdopterin-guanine dinucleotide biosynthesis protein MobB